jgi:hypothetical protein
MEQFLYSLLVQVIGTEFNTGSGQYSWGSSQSGSSTNIG